MSNLSKYTLASVAGHDEFRGLSDPQINFILQFYDFENRSKDTDYLDHLEATAKEVGLRGDGLETAMGRIISVEMAQGYSRAVARFLRMQDNRKWALYCALEDQFWQNIESIRTPLDPMIADDKREKALADRAKNRENTEVLRQRLEQLDTELWPDPQKDVVAKVVRKGLTKISIEGRVKSKNT